MTLDFEPVDDLTGPGEAKSNLDLLARLFPDAVVDGTVDIEALRDLLGDNASANTAEAFGLRWPGMAEARRLSTLPATGTLLPKPEESVDWDNTRNIMIEGDNLEVLRLLRRGYTNKVDVIYIDPPYNTGNDFVYDDKRTTSQADHEAAAGQRDEEGALQTGRWSDRAQDRKVGASLHTKWLSMMYPRLLVAHHLLKETGAIMVAIDDTEHARLKLLMDRIFGAENFIASIVWQGGRKNDSRYISVGHDYMLIYAKNEGVLRQRDIRWREKKPGVDEILVRAAEIWSSNADKQKANEVYRKYLKGMEKMGARAGVLRFASLDEATGRPYNADRDLSSPNLRASGIYDIYHPVTGKAVTRPQRGWAMTEESARQMIAEGRIAFGEDETKIPRGKIFLDEMSDQVAESVFSQERTAAGKALVKLLGADVFPFPKDVKVVARWLDIASLQNPNAIFLDFFAGSGSTGHSVMDLNAADGGNRRYILVQLDEPVDKDGYDTIADITRERLRRAGQQIVSNQSPDAAHIDTGFRSYHLASSNLKPWNGTPDQLNLLESVDNLVASRTTDDLLVEMMLRLGVDLTTPLETRKVAGSTLYNLAGTLFAYFGTDITVERASEVAKALVAWRDEDPGDADTTVVVRDTGFVDSSAKLNFAAAVEQAGFTTLRSI
ncbi:site-specific DNA-methyltransferase [Streptomyces sp. NWU339]|uniref:site-specific DNA-methyltransferase n=1 Tax=Streptomyces sp. NWU339 TaxID=2185284 RepID=UPI000D67BFE7|nr:site-specific DNA-methyltransferase [Streptomyces sp. NWU339]PWI12250.1 site-specific DNA-methyltransferase [Streptomyces sp. NWU339]